MSFSLAKVLGSYPLTESRMEEILCAMEGYSDRAIRLHAGRLREVCQSEDHRQRGEIPMLETPSAQTMIPWYRFGRWLDDQSLRPSQHLGFAVGDYYIQDAGSMLALELLDLEPHHHVCDVCAAPGGKASGILDRLGTDGFLLANEPIQSRLESLYWSLARSGNLRWGIMGSDPSGLLPSFAESFDRVLVDAPCSGQTLVSRGKREENAFAPHQIEHSAQRQRRILESAIRLLRPGGILVYSTCTFATLENEEQIRGLVARYPGCWEPVMHDALQAWSSEIEPGCYRLWPDRDRCAGAFGAALRLKETLPPGDDFEEVVSRPRSSKRVAKVVPSPTLQALGTLANVHVWREGDAAYGCAEELIDRFERYQATGMRSPRLASETGREWVPEYALGMLGSATFQAARRSELTDTQACAFMRGEAIPMEAIDPATSANSWQQLTWHGKPLGWGKQVGTRWNNYLPKYARLQIDARSM